VIEVVRSGPLTTVQDLGRPGYAHLGVPHAGAADLPSLCLANRLVGNPEDAAGLELTFGGAALRLRAAAWIAVTGARLPILVDGRPYGMNAPLRAGAGALVELGVPTAGLRTYLAVRGGIDVEPVLGSRSTDLLSHLGPDPLTPGDHLPVGAAAATDAGWPGVDVAPVRALPAEPVLRVVAGPRADWFVDPGVLAGQAYEVAPASNRVGVRLDGRPLERATRSELASEGMVTGALQVPPNGLPIVFLADHPTTGGYPVVGVVVAADLPLAGQLRPGQRVRFRHVR